jgi:hypothetical protein
MAIANVFLAAIASVGAIFYLQTRDKYVKLKYNSLGLFAEHLGSVHRILSQRTGLSNYVYAIENATPGIEPAGVFDEVEKYIQYSLEETRYLFERATGRKCACTIKLIIASDNGNLSVKTFARDSRSAKERGKIDNKLPQFDPLDHTPFGELISNRSASKGYVENDLSSLAERGVYRNANPNWRKYYNATCVVPIYRPDRASSDEDPKFTVLGFLCIDSMHGRFDREFSVEILKIISNALYYTFETMLQFQKLYAVDEKIHEQEEKYKND